MQQFTLTCDRLKIALVGAPKTGKTSYIQKVSGIPEEDYEPTIGVDYYKLDLKTERSEYLPILCWDCANTETYRSLVLDEYAPHVEGVIVFYDCSKQKTYDPHAFEWIQQMKSRMQNEPSIMLLATKTDKAVDGEMVEEGRAFAKANKLLFQQCSVIHDSPTELERFILKVARSILLKNRERYKRLYRNTEELAKNYSWLLPI